MRFATSTGYIGDGDEPAAGAFRVGHNECDQAACGRPAARPSRPAWRPVRPAPRPAGRPLQGLLALGLYLAVWLPTLARPLVLHPTWAQLDQQNPDPNFYVWGMRWWPYAIAHGINPLFSTQIAAPAGHALAWVTTAPPLVLLAAPLTLTAGPLVAFNLVTAAALPISAWAAFVLCRRLTGRFWPSIVGGAVYGFSAFEMGGITSPARSTSATACCCQSLPTLSCDGAIRASALALS